ncbi:MAG: triose-phosphate isomerase [Legionellales bacterium]|nr:triose-phosphate isomerase [Legionellales bacterium]
MVAGNWKMHGSYELVGVMRESLNCFSNDEIDIVLFPPFLYLPEMAKQFQNSSLTYGAQNCANHLQGAYTGEVSALMLAEIGCRYVILGHSERRAIYHETDTFIAEKVKMAISCDLIPILCIGETGEEREANQTDRVLQEQLQAIISLPESEKVLSKLVIAYEPIWAIGTGKTATPKLAQETHSQIRQFLAQYLPKEQQSIRLLYGGSVKADNAAKLIAMPDIDGFLVGGASLDSTQFVSICQAAIEGR